MNAFNAGDADQAAELFQDESWKAAAYYRAGEYEKSNALLDQPANATDYYNKGNVLAKLGSYPDAIEAYDRALSMDPDNEDARFNRELVKKALEQQQSQQEQQQSGDPSEQQQDQSQQQQSQDPSQQQQDQQASDQQQQDDQSAEQEQGKEQKQDQLSDIKENSEQQQQDSDKQQKQQPEAQQEDEQQPEDQQPLQAQQQDEAYEQEDAETVESEQAMEQWLRRIPDDPGGLMRRKFIYQYRQMPNQAEAQEPW
jgi:Ca-activated chloride channel family protein